MKILYDAKLKRPGCVILQAFGGTVPDFTKLFPSESWIVSPTPDLRLYEVNEHQLKRLVEITEAELERTRGKGKEEPAGAAGG